MGKAFGFNDEELKLLLVAVRQMRRTFAAAEKAGTGADLRAYAELYDSLYEKLRGMSGPLPEEIAEAL